MLDDNGTNGFRPGALCTSDTSKCCTPPFSFCSDTKPVYCLNANGFARCRDDEGNASPGVICADGICCPQTKQCCETGRGKFRCCDKDEGGVGKTLQLAETAKGNVGPTPIPPDPLPGPGPGPVMQSPSASPNGSPQPDPMAPDDATNIENADGTPSPPPLEEESTGMESGGPGLEGPVGAQNPTPTDDLIDADLSPSPDGADGGDSESVCLPARAVVEVLGRGKVRVDEVETGELVRVGGGQYSRVFMWTHRDARYIGRRYVRVEGEGGVVLTVTEGHVVYVCRGVEKDCARDAVVAEEVQPGDGVWSVGDEGVRLVVVTKVRRGVVDRGLYNPQTARGDLVVDGVLVSCYTRFVDMGAAHALLAPLRAMFSVGLSIRTEI